MFTERVSTNYVLSKNKKNIKIFHLKTVNFKAVTSIAKARYHNPQRFFYVMRAIITHSVTVFHISDPATVKGERRPVPVNLFKNNADKMALQQVAEVTLSTRCPDLDRALSLQRWWPRHTVCTRYHAFLKLLLNIFLAHLSQRLIGELRGYPWSGVVVLVVRPQFQMSSPKPLGQSKPNFMWSLLGKGEPTFI